MEGKCHYGGIQLECEEEFIVRIWQGYAFMGAALQCSLGFIQTSCQWNQQVRNMAFFSIQKGVVTRLLHISYFLPFILLCIEESWHDSCPILIEIGVIRSFKLSMISFLLLALSVITCQLYVVKYIMYFSSVKFVWYCNLQSIIMSPGWFVDSHHFFSSIEESCHDS